LVIADEKGDRGAGWRPDAGRLTSHYTCPGHLYAILIPCLAFAPNRYSLFSIYILDFSLTPTLQLVYRFQAIDEERPLDNALMHSLKSALSACTNPGFKITLNLAEVLL